MNRKLIRTTLAEIKDREAHQKEIAAELGLPVGDRATTPSPAQTSGRKKSPASETNAEAYYYKKQMESRTPMVFVLQDGEQVEGIIEWYDRAALKIYRQSAPNILLLKHNVKYMFKADEREAVGSES